MINANRRHRRAAHHAADHEKMENTQHKNCPPGSRWLTRQATRLGMWTLPRYQGHGLPKTTTVSPRKETHCFGGPIA
ncbi:MAG: hypothetical protein ABSE63_00055 [Thermoguttaceae bacterium]